MPCSSSNNATCWEKPSPLAVDGEVEKEEESVLGDSANPRVTLIGKTELTEADSGNDSANVGGEVVDRIDFVDHASVHEAEAHEIPGEVLGGKAVDQEVVDSSKEAKRRFQTP